MDQIIEKYWTDFLPELSTTVKRMGDSQLQILQKIKKKQVDIETLSNEFAAKEKELNELIRGSWSNEEIENALSQDYIYLYNQLKPKLNF